MTSNITHNHLDDLAYRQHALLYIELQLQQLDAALVRVGLLTAEAAEDAQHRAAVHLERELADLERQRLR